MRKAVIMAMLWATVLTAAAQRLQVKTPLLDVGKTGFGVPVTATFELRARGGRHLHIDKVTTDCGCTVADYPKGSIGNGEKFNVSLTYDARLLGHFTKQAAVWLRGADTPVWLTMKGVVLTEVKDYSRSFPYAFGDLLADVNNVEFDDVNIGENPEVVINIINISDKPMQPNLLHLPAYLSAYATPETLPPGRAGKLTLSLNSRNLHDYGLTQTSVYVAENLGDTVSSSIELPVSVVLLPSTTQFEGSNRQYAPRLQLSADSLTLGRVNGKNVKSQYITIANTGRLPLKISSLQMFTKGLKVTLGQSELQPQTTTRLKVEVANRDELMAARQRPRVLMITNDPDHSKVVITIKVK